MLFARKIKINKIFTNNPLQKVIPIIGSTNDISKSNIITKEIPNMNIAISSVITFPLKQIDSSTSSITTIDSKTINSNTSSIITTI